MAPSGIDCLLATYAHVPVIGGSVVPVFIWIIYKSKKDGAEVAFQAKQAAIFQCIALAILILWVALINVAFHPPIDGQSLTGWLLMFAWIGFVLFAAACVLCAVLAAWKTLNGEEFIYPVIGKRLKT